MKKKFNSIYAAVSLILLISVGIYFTFSTLLSNIPLGLDLGGGVEILYSVEPIDGNLTQDDMDSTIATLNLRVNGLGLSEPYIVQEGDNYIRIQLPGASDQNEARRILGSTAVLSFRDYQDNLVMSADVLKEKPATASTDQLGRPAVQLAVADKSLFYEKTSYIASLTPNNQMPVWLDFDSEVNNYLEEQVSCGNFSTSNCISDAYVSSGINGDAIITGVTKEDAEILVQLINSGSLRVNLVEEYITTVGASFGDIALKASILSAIVGIIIVMAYMTIFYRLAGLISSFAIIAYTYVVFLLFYLLGGVLSLPSFAALVIGVGMSIDASVITYERIKEELSSGLGIKQAFANGTKKSFTTILDANITTLIIAIILYIFGQSSIKGFATMFIINIFVTFVVIILLTRFIIKLLVNSNVFNKSEKIFVGYRDQEVKNRDFVKHAKKMFIVSVTIIVIGMSSGFIRGFNLGVDFTSGTSITINQTEAVFKKYVTDIDKSYEVVSSNYVSSEGVGNVRINEVMNEDEITSITNYTDENYGSEVIINKVSPAIGKQLLRNALISLLLGFFLMVIYITIRFKKSFAFAALIALFHDLLIVLAIFGLFKLELNGTIIAALLAILGYSINDTIVIFDRIRDSLNNKLTKRKTTLTYEELEEVVNHSLSSTLMRSINTSITALLPVICLILFGSSEILEFNIALLVGLIAGTYSSIFIASQVWLKMFRNGYSSEKKKNSLFDLSDEVHEVEL